MNCPVLPCRSSRTKALHAELSEKGKGSADAVMALVDEGADVNALMSANNGKVSCYPLYLAAANGHTACIPVLIDAGADVNAVSKNVCQVERGREYKDNKSLILPHLLLLLLRARRRYTAR
jgi:hypothetical protein